MNIGVMAGLALAASGMGMTQETAPESQGRMSVVSATSRIAVLEWDRKIEALARQGELLLLSTRADTMLEGRSHSRFLQLYQGVPVWGGELVRQEDSAGTLSVFGSVFEGIDLETQPTLIPSAARSAMFVQSPGGLSLFPDQMTLVILPLEGGNFALAWQARVLTGSDVRMTFLDAHSGEVLLEYSDLKTQQAVGTGAGVLGDRKKISATGAGSSFSAQDALRPPTLQTLDMRGNLNRLLDIFAGFPDSIASSDFASDADNDWTDGATVDAHVYAGYTYDYFFKRFGRRGLDNANIPIRSFVHPVNRNDVLRQSSEIVGRFYLNASYYGEGVMVYGEGLPGNFSAGGQRWNYLAGGLDVVAHELTHGVTDYSSRLIYMNESGALNESFSDMMAVAIEFSFQPPGNGPRQADYLLGEDVITAFSFPLNGVRSMQNPASFGDPDHYSGRYTGPLDNGGVHFNSAIPNYAYFLAIEGGTHRLGGVVTGVGAANREQIERVFYRAFTSFLGPSSNFSAARAATIQAAIELYPSNPAVQAAVTQAWSAVGVN